MIIDCWRPEPINRLRLWYRSFHWQDLSYKRCKHIPVLTFFKKWPLAFSREWCRCFANERVDHPLDFLSGTVLRINHDSFLTRLLIVWNRYLGGERDRRLEFGYLLVPNSERLNYFEKRRLGLTVEKPNFLLKMAFFKINSFQPVLRSAKTLVKVSAQCILILLLINLFTFTFDSHGTLNQCATWTCWNIKAKHFLRSMQSMFRSLWSLNRSKMWRLYLNFVSSGN